MDEITPVKARFIIFTSKEPIKTFSQNNIRRLPKVAAGKTIWGNLEIK